MKKAMSAISISIILLIGITSCKKSKTINSDYDKMAGFWTYKEDAANDYFNANVLFKSDSTFTFYQYPSSADTSAAQAIADTAHQWVTFGTYTVNGKNVTMIGTQADINGIYDFTFTGTLNDNSNILIGYFDSKSSLSASGQWYLTKP